MNITKTQFKKGKFKKCLEMQKIEITLCNKIASSNRQ